MMSFEEVETRRFERNPYTNGYHNAREYLLKIFDFAKGVFDETEQPIQKAELKYCGGERQDFALLDSVAHAIPSDVELSLKPHDWPDHRKEMPQLYASVELSSPGVSVKAAGEVTLFFNHEWGAVGEPNIVRTLEITAPSFYFESERWEKRERQLTAFWPRGHGYSEL